MLDYFSFIIDGCKLTSIAQTGMVKLTYGLHVREITPLRKLKCEFQSPDHALNMNPWGCNSSYGSFDARADTLFLRIIGGAISTVSCKAKRSWMLKFLVSHYSIARFSFSRKPLTFTISLSLILPLYNFETKLKCKIGDNEMSNLNVFKDLYWL